MKNLQVTTLIWTLKACYHNCHKFKHFTFFVTISQAKFFSKNNKK